MRLTGLDIFRSLLICAAMPAILSGQIMTTAAGTTWIFPGNGPALSRPLGSLQGVTVDNAGNVYLTDALNDLVARVSPSGSLTVIAGNGVGGYSGDGGPAVNASMSAPTGIAQDASGNLYFCENGGFRIRRVSAAGVITTIAGTGVAGYSGDGGPALNAQMANVHGIALGPDGSIYFADWGNNRVRKISPSGTITTVAGNGVGAFSGDGGPATKASLWAPDGLSLDSAGNLFIADQFNSHVRKVSASGVISSIGGAGGCPTGVAADQQGGAYVADPCRRFIYHYQANGSVVTVGGNGSGLNEPSGDGGPALEASFEEWDIARDASGNLWISGPDYGRLYEITTDGTFHIVAGNGGYLVSPEGTLALRSYLLQPTGVTMDSDGNLYIAESGHNRIRKIDSSGAMYTISGNGRNGFLGDGGPASGGIFWNPSHLRFSPSGSLYIADPGNNRIRRIDSNGILNTFAGNGAGAYSGDNGQATSAALNNPMGVVSDPSGNIFIADTNNNRIRKVSPGGVITTVAGNGQAGYSGDGGPATQGQLSSPVGLDFDSAGNLYIADAGNNAVRRLSPGGVLSTFAGPSTGLSSPNDVLAAPDGSIYIADSGNGLIRRVTPSGAMIVAAGNGLQTYAGDGGPATSAALNSPAGITLDKNGNLYIADGGNNRIREVLDQSSSFSLSAPTTKLTFNVVAGGTPPAPQTVSLSAPVTGLAFTTSVSAPWVTVAPPSGAIPGVLQVSIDPSTLSAGVSNAAIAISAPAVSSVLAISVTVNVAAAPAPSLAVSPPTLTFTASQQGSPAPQTIQVLNNGGGSLPFTAQVASGGSWLAISAPTGTATAAAPASLSVTATALTLAPGTYAGSITITGAGSSITIPVTLSVAGPTATLVVSQNALTVNAVAQGGTPLAQSFGILNSGQGAMDWAATATTLSGGNWLTVSTTSGTVQTPYLDVALLNASVSTAGLAAGTYYGTIQIASNAAVNSPQSLTVILNVLPAGSNLGPQLYPGGLIFTGVTGANPSSQDVQLVNSAAGSNSFLSSSIGPLSFLPTNAVINSDQPTTIHVYPSFSSLAPGITRGTITLQFDDGSPAQSINVLMSVAPAAGPTSDETGRPTVTAKSSSCPPQALNVIFRQPLPAIAFSATAGQSMTLEAAVSDACGNPVAPGSQQPRVIVNATNGDTIPPMAYIGSGIWQTSWPVQNTAEATAVTVTALILSGNTVVGGQATLHGAVVPPAPSRIAPLVSTVIHAASSVSGAPIAPGELIAIKGANLANGSGTNLSAPLPLTANGAQVFLGQQALPILYSSAGQMNVQVPFTLPLNTTYQLTVQVQTENGGVISVPQTVVIAPVQPGIFTTNESGTGQGEIFLSDDVTHAAPGTPASIGEVVVIYATGLGAVMPSVPAGQAAPPSPLSTVTNPVTVTMGGVAAQVLFAGLTPGAPGVYQINAIVPAGVQPGDTVPVIISSAGLSSPGGVTMAIH